MGEAQVPYLVGCNVATPQWRKLVVALDGEGKVGFGVRNSQGASDVVDDVVQIPWC